MDPLVDKLWSRRRLFRWCPQSGARLAATAVVARDFLIGTALNGQRQRPDSSSEASVNKTSWQIITIIFFLALLSIAELRRE
jgi:hypothetical protein